MNVSRTDVDADVFVLVVATVTVYPTFQIADLLQILVYCHLLTRSCTGQMSYSKYSIYKQQDM